MAIPQKLHTKLVQKLILTPSLQQAIKLLPMSTLELADLLNQEMVENPLLEEVPTEDLQPAEQTQQEKPADQPSTEKTDQWDDADYEYFFGDYLDDGYRSRTPSEVKELPPIENTLSSGTSLSDHLLWQLTRCRRKTRSSARSAAPSSATWTTTAISWPRSRRSRRWASGRSTDVEKALQHVQTFDPIGVAARDLQECLWLQIRHLGLEGTPTEKIVTEHLRLLQNHQVPEIARRLGHADRGSQGAHRDHPEPRSEAGQPLQPAAVAVRHSRRLRRQGRGSVRRDAERGGAAAAPHQPDLPAAARQERRRHDRGNNETRAYVKDKFRSALWLIKSVDQRQKTIQKVANSIINFQREFLDHGIEYLRPLVLRDVANDIGMHESTVSRVVNNKYMHTPQGVFELKYFFHSGISSSYGDSVSSVTIKQRIRKIIENEDPRKPLSDSKIVSILQKEGLMLARRTIAKYREELKIPTSNQRKVLY